MLKLYKSNNYFFFVLGFWGMFLTLSCSKPDTKADEIAFFPWAKTLQTELDYLKKSQLSVNKTIIVDKQKESQVLSNIDFEKEFKLFLDTDLNKASYKNSYDDLSEENFVWYSLKTNENLPVKKFKMEKDERGRPIQVEITLSQRNFLFETEKQLHLHYSEGHIQTYSVNGYQKIRWLTPTNYQLMGVILPKQSTR